MEREREVQVSWALWQGTAQGAFLGAAGTPGSAYQMTTEPIVIEALGLRDGLRFARCRGFSKVIVETDCHLLGIKVEAGGG